jgi:hypothetical protein
MISALKTLKIAIRKDGDHWKLQKLNLEVINTFFSNIIGFCSEK